MNWIFLGIILFFTVSEAVYEGLYLNGKKAISGVIEFVHRLGVPVVIIWALIDYTFIIDLKMFGFWYLVKDFMIEFILGWVFIRYAIFDYIHNLSAGLHLAYIGSSKLSDKHIFKKFESMWGPSFFRWTRFILLLVGLSLIIFIQAV